MAPLPTALPLDRRMAANKAMLCLCMYATLVDFDSR